MLAATLLGALAFPLLKTIIETFDGSPPFFRRVGRSYRDPLLYRPRRGRRRWAGIRADRWDCPPETCRAGPGSASSSVPWPMRASTCSAISFGAARPRPGPAARYYVVHALLGGFIGAAIGFYLDASQVAVVVAKFHRYLAAGHAAASCSTSIRCVSKWGFLNLGVVTGGVSLLFAEALAGVISWSIAAWLFAINRTFMAAYFEGRDADPRAVHEGRAWSSSPRT